MIDGKAAFIYYIGAEQINVLVPDDSTTGTVAVTVTSSNGTSNAASVKLQPILPGLFVQGNYVAAVRVSDGAVVSGTAVKAGDVLEVEISKIGTLRNRIVDEK